MQSGLQPAGLQRRARLPQRKRHVHANFGAEYRHNLRQAEGKCSNEDLSKIKVARVERSGDISFIKTESVEPIPGNAEPRSFA